VVQVAGHRYRRRVTERLGWRPAALVPAGPCCRQTGVGALANQVALKLGDGAEDVEDEPTTGRGGIDVLGEALEADAARLEVGQRLDKVLEGATEAVEALEADLAARAHVRKRLHQTRPFGFGAGGDVR
jgi:hypothetical protein